MRCACFAILYLAALTVCVSPAGAQTAVAAPPGADLKIFEAATSFANTLTSWAFLMIGGSIVAILGTSYYRPSSLWVRCAYFAFVPAWFCLSWSIYAGTRVQGVYLAALYSRAPKIVDLKEALNNDAISQINRMEAGLAFFGIWLTIYLAWWVFNNERKEAKP
jgi:hypothetical protein